MATIKRVVQFLFLFFFLGFVLSAILYLPYLQAYYKFVTTRKENASVIRGGELTANRSSVKVKDENFGLVIPKIGINSKVTANVNPFSDYEYEPALKMGIAHSRGSAVPGKKGTIILFANAPGGFFEVQKSNTAFYFLDKLSEGDPIYIYYKSVQYKYSVARKEVLDIDSINFFDLNADPKYETLNIMTLWPPGTSILRYVVEAERLNI